MSSHHIAIATEMKIDDKMLAVWERGCVELYDEVSRVADLIPPLEKALYGVERTGVFAYDISEQLGPYLAKLVLAGDKAFADDAFLLELGRLACTLFEGAGAEAIIRDYTGYDKQQARRCAVNRAKHFFDLAFNEYLELPGPSAKVAVNEATAALNQAVKDLA